MKNYILPIEKELNTKMHEYCAIFCLIGTPRETPRFLNFGDFDENTKILTIESTQSPKLFFEIKTNFDFIECELFWQQFKQYRTNFLTTNYPTINTL